MCLFHNVYQNFPGMRRMRWGKGQWTTEQGPETHSDRPRALTTPPPLQSSGSLAGAVLLAAPPSPHGLVWTPSHFPAAVGLRGRAGLRQTGAGVRSLKSFLSVISPGRRAVLLTIWDPSESRSHGYSLIPRAVSGKIAFQPALKTTRWDPTGPQR